MESTSVRTEWDAVVFNSKSRSYGASEWKSIEQRLPVTWTAGHLSGQTAVRGSSARFVLMAAIAVAARRRRTLCR